jgi:hypothetical protein
MFHTLEHLSLARLFRGHLGLTSKEILRHYGAQVSRVQIGAPRFVTAVSNRVLHFHSSQAMRFRAFGPKQYDEAREQKSRIARAILPCQDHASVTISDPAFGIFNYVGITVRISHRREPRRNIGIPCGLLSLM